MRIFICCLVLITFFACKKESHAPTTPLNEMKDTTAKLVATGVFQNGPYGTVSGKGGLYKNFDGSYAVALESFVTSNGPDLYVYLSKEIMPVNFIEAGKLKSTAGNQVYNLPTVSNVAGYRYICIHCKAFNHLFGYATLP